jgi:hypothetical protein
MLKNAYLSLSAWTGCKWIIYKKFKLNGLTYQMTSHLLAQKYIDIKGIGTIEVRTIAPYDVVDFMVLAYLTKPNGHSKWLIRKEDV